VCGIVGFLRPEGVDPADLALVAGATAALRHRGPDGVGYWHGGPVAFGHARLSVIDWTSGHQPQFNEDHALSVTLNGEIYNYKALRSELSSLGHQFRTQSDTEVVVHGYEQWGDRVVEHLDGMFAFALWDSRRRRLLLARDRFGEKPLYYTTLPGEAGTFFFASEIKALLSSPLVPRALAAEHLDEYLLFRHVLAPATMFTGIFQVQPGHLLVIEAGRTRDICWYLDKPSTAQPTSADDDVEALLTDSVVLRLMSDVNLGTVLSGGIDSSLVSVIAARHTSRLDTFCVGFADPKYDERPFARAVAHAIGSTHHELVLSPNDFAQELPRLTWANDEPLTHPNSIAMHLVFRFAKMEHGVTVLLSGEGADEVFGGYDWYRAMLTRDTLQRIPGVRPAAALIPGHRGATVRRLLDPDYPLVANAFARPSSAAAVLGREIRIPDSRRIAWPADSSGIEGLFQYDQHTYLPALLQRQDRMSMAAGVEARVVFLSHRLVEWANRQPTRVKVSKEGTKLPLRALIRKILPMFPVDRPKVGFTLPLAEWMAPGGSLAPSINALTSANSFVGDWLDHRAIAGMATSAQGRKAQTDMLWTLLALEEWGSTFLGGAPAPLELPGAHSSLLLPAPPSHPNWE